MAALEDGGEPRFYSGGSAPKATPYGDPATYSKRYDAWVAMGKPGSNGGLWDDLVGTISGFLSTPEGLALGLVLPELPAIRGILTGSPSAIVSAFTSLPDVPDIPDLTEIPDVPDLPTEVPDLPTEVPPVSNGDYDWGGGDWGDAPTPDLGGDDPFLPSPD